MSNEGERRISFSSGSVKRESWIQWPLRALLLLNILKLGKNLKGVDAIDEASITYCGFRVLPSL